MYEVNLTRRGTIRIYWVGNYWFSLFKTLTGFFQMIKEIKNAKRLPEKLKQIRAALRLNQKSLLGWIDTSETNPEIISRFERGTASPSQAQLESYAALINAEVQALLDDDLDLPEKIPSPKLSKGVPHGKGLSGAPTSYRGPSKNR